LRVTKRANQKPRGKSEPPPPSTVPPPFDPDEYARESESMIVPAPAISSYSMHPTVPPEADYEALRESCSTQMVAAAPVPFPSEDAVDAQSEVRVVSRPPSAPDDDLPSLDSVPVLAVAPEDLAWFDLDVDTSALLAKVNGKDSIKKIAAKSTIAPFDVQLIFYELAKVGAVELR
jgi:hypothetical protein